jgi:hypothetical protein
MARDWRAIRVFSEAALPYEVRLVSFRAMKEAAHLALHNLAGYLARGEARPADQRAFEAQLAVNASKKS